MNTFENLLQSQLKGICEIYISIFDKRELNCHEDANVASRSISSSNVFLERVISEKENRIHDASLWNYIDGTKQTGTQYLRAG